jgi:hypothetical protein
MQQYFTKTNQSPVHGCYQENESIAPEPILSSIHSDTVA